MALGFGFNKAKILSAAEKYVQQGKLPNAIAEYEKVSKQDPKDLTVLNTIGDLNARLGRADQATEYFRKVGEAYAADGFVVKAIAMYKKLTKLNPGALDSMVRLAELYSQQGLYNDARSQYAAVADQYLKSNDRERATGILKKMLDLDPDNAAMQAKVADLYLKLGKSKEALEIYFNSAQSLYQRGTLDAAEAALARVVKLDAAYAPALLLRGQIASESGNHAVAIECLSKLPDLDSRPEALRPLLLAYIKAGRLTQAEDIVTKLVTAHNDLEILTTFARVLFDAGDPEQAMSVYEQHAEKLLAGDKKALIESLTASVSKARESGPALVSLLAILQKAGVTGHALREVQELLAHSCVQSGELQRAADLYRELSEVEPDNPLHDQNYRQIVTRMGKDAATRELSVEEGGQALMVDELDAAPAILQEYPRDLAEAITSALTDSELFSSYNVPEKAITPLERVLPKAPNDIRVRQRLASLYARLSRFADAANTCTVLADVHVAAGLTEQALQFREMAARYTEQAVGTAATAPSFQESQRELTPRSSSTVSSEEPGGFQASSVVEFQVTPRVEAPSVAEFDLTAVPAEDLPDSSVPASDSEQGAEWEDMLTVEEPAAAGAGSPAEGQVREIATHETPDEVLEEARFYLSQGMQAEAQSAIARLESIAPNHPDLGELRSSAEMGEAAVADGPVVAEEQPATEVQQPLAAEIEPAEPIAQSGIVSTEEVEVLTDEEAEEVELPRPSMAEEPAKASVRRSQAQETIDDGPLEDLIPEVAAGEPASFTTPIGVRPAVHSIPPTGEAPVISARSAGSANPLADLVSDLEEVLDDFGSPPAAPPQRVPVSPQATSVPSRMASSSAPSSPSPAVVSPAADSGETNSMLADLLDEFKEGIEEPAEEADDPDTHYNLGVAFREMGLLDEAIGELQKVCRALDSGSPFSQPIQAYTWLAQCLVDKGAAQAAIRWYERALHVRGISQDSRLAVHYDMANAFEAAGNRKAALDNFMEVYGSNIDYRDVADRIRSLNK